MSVHKSVPEFTNNSDTKNIILAYEGELNPQIATSVISLAEKNLDVKHLDYALRKKAFHIAVECLQNMSSHAEKNNDFPNIIFLIGHDGPEFFIRSGNVINAGKVQSLKRKIDHINNLDTDGLKQLHMQAIKESMSKQDCSNPGLGLISIARKSGQKIDYRFIEMDTDNAYFWFSASFKSA